MATSLRITSKLNNVLRLNSARNIMTSAKRCEEAVDELKKNPYFEKYASKIANLQHTSPEEFLSRIEQTTKTKGNKETSREDRNYSALLSPKAPIVEKPQNAGEESLDKIMKTDLLQDKTADEIKEIWLKYHSDKDAIAATIPVQDFEEFDRRSKEHPTFLFALPRSQGYEFIMSQFEGRTVHMTPLLYFQVHKENAPECLTITHYTEFKDSKGLVLMRGIFDKNVINVQEAQCLANQLQMYYAQNHPSKLQLLETFTKSPDSFKHMDLIKEIENLTIT